MLRDNDFGQLMKLGLVLWSALCLYWCGDAVVRIGRVMPQEPGPAQSGYAIGALGGLGIIFVTWAGPSFALTIAYVVFGRSEAHGRSEGRAAEKAQPEPDPEPEKWRTAPERISEVADSWRELVHRQTPSEPTRAAQPPSRIALAIVVAVVVCVAAAVAGILIEGR